MFVKRLIRKAVLDASSPVPPGNLKAEQLSLQLAVHHGIPYTASVLAYEPVQRILAVSSSDGRTKIFGAVGVEGLLQSPTNFPCKFLEFVNNRGLLLHVNTQNDIEVWDVERLELVFFQKWEAEITSFSVLQGAPFSFVGDGTGAVSVLQFVDDKEGLVVMPYSIPAHVALGGIVRIGYEDAPPVIGVLPQPDVFFSRLLIAFGNGLMILWGLHERQVFAVRGGTEDQQLQLSNFSNTLKGRATSTRRNSEEKDEELEEDKEICCVCWACPVGTVLAVGYTDGEILFWSFPSIVSEKGQMETEFVEGPAYSREPVHTVDLAPGKAKMPVVGLTWGASVQSSRGIGGRLYVFGGREVGQIEALTILSLDSLNEQESGVKLLELELSLHGPFADMALLPAPGGSLTTPAAALALLMMPALLHVFDDLSIANYFAALVEDTPPPYPQPFPLQLPVTASEVTCAKLVLVSKHGMTAQVLLQLPQTKRSPVPSSLPAGTKWPISGGALSATSSGQLGEVNLYITGHDNGIVNIWDGSSQFYRLLCTVQRQSELGLNSETPVSTFEFCATTGLLAVGSADGMVFVYKVCKEAHKLKCVVLDSTTTKEELLHCAPGFRCILVETVHKAPINSISLASGLPSHMAVGDEKGMISIVNLNSQSVSFFLFPTHSSPILSVAFSSEPKSGDSTPLSPRSPRLFLPKSKSSPVAMGDREVLYVVAKDATMVAIDGSTGLAYGSGSMKPKTPSTAVSLHLLDAGGADVTLLNGQLDETLQPGDHTDHVELASTPTSSVKEEPLPRNLDEEQPGDQTDQVELASTATKSVEEEALQRNSDEEQPGDQTDQVELASTATTCLQEEPLQRSSDEGQFCLSYTRRTHSEAVLLLLCCTDSLRLYATHDVIQGHRNILRKVKLDKICSWTSSFSIKSGKESGLIVMFSTGDLEFRSLPDLGLLKQTSLSTVLNWKVEPTMLLQKTMACNAKADFVLVDQESELVYVSVIEGDNIRDQVPLPRLYDKDLAKAATAAITYARNVPKKKPTPIQGILGGVLKEIRNVLDFEHQQTVHFASELPKLFNSSLFTVPIEGKQSTTSEGSGSSLHSTDFANSETEDWSDQPSPAEGSKRNKLANKMSGVIKGLKGKERSNALERDRMELFDGAAEPQQSKARTLDDIKAKYGHPRKSQEIGSALDQARNKLAERGEKLQDISDKTAEMEDNAQNFASMAEELAKKVAGRKWWEF